jgi:hypothetical protein
VFARSLWGAVVTLQRADCDVQASSAAAPSFNMSDALWCARKGFDKSSVRDGSKKIVVITCDPCPCGLMTENDESRLPPPSLPLAAARAPLNNSVQIETISCRLKRLVRDIADANISVTCMPITLAAAFDLTTFWRMVRVRSRVAAPRPLIHAQR